MMSRIRQISLIRLIRLTKKSLITIFIAWIIIVGSGLLYLFGPWTKDTEAVWFDDNWGYRQIIAVTNNGSVQTDYQVQIIIDTATLITAGKLQSDCDDLRVTEFSGKIIPIWIEYCSTTGSSSIWAKASSVITTTSNFYVYYGNPAAASTSQFTSLPIGINIGTGNDGSITVATNKDINVDNQISGRSCADGGDGVNYSVTANTSSGQNQITLSSTPASGCLAAGDEVLIINLQGTSGNFSTVGNYETARINSIATATLTLNHNLVNSYDGTTQKIMVQRVPNYNNVTVNSSTTFTATAWNATKGGVMFFRSKGTVANSGTIDMKGKGYAGGASPAIGQLKGAQGDSYKGAGATLTNGANAGAGGGGDEHNASRYGSGGGGGGYSSAGTAGTQACSPPALSTGAAGATYGDSALAQLFLGSGGGSGGPNNNTFTPPTAAGGAGGTGGGILVIAANTITASSTITAKGNDGSTSNVSAPAGGGGSGGSLLLNGGTVTLGSGLVLASGGAGGTGDSCGAGGTGGNGRAVVNYSSTSGASTPAATSTALPMAAAPASEEKAPSPVAYWKFDDGTGTNARDSTVNNNDGTISGATWQTEDQCVSGKCLYFDGSNDVVTVSNSVANIQTVSFWVKPITTSEQLIDLNGSAYIDLSSGTISATGFTSPTIYVNGKVSSTLSANQWQYVTVTTGTGLTGSAIKVGQISTNYGQIFIDEVKIYSYARSAAQIQVDYNARANNEGASGVLGQASNNNYQALNNGMTAYWKMDEASGTRADSSGNGNTLTDSTTVPSTAGKFGNAGSFTKSPTEYLNITDNASLSIGASSFTLSGWFYINNWPSGEHSVIISKNNAATSSYEYYLYLDGNVGTRKLLLAVSSDGTSGNVTSITSTTTLSLSTWYFYTAWYDKDGGTINLQVNNGTVDSQSYTAGSVYDGNNAVRISGHGNSTYFWDGRLDEIRLYKRALSSAERTALYNFAPGPLAHWKMDDGNWNGTSGEVKDASGNGLNGTTVGGASVVSGKYGSAGKFDGVDEAITVADTASLRLSNSLTVEAWFKTTTTSNYVGIARKDTETGTRYLWGINLNGLNYENTGKVSGEFWNGSHSAVASSTAKNDGNWHHAVLTISGTTLAFYVDGVLQGTTSVIGTQGIPTGELDIGANPPNTGGGRSGIMNGLIDDVKIYNYARTQKQIVEDMNAGHPAVGSPIGSAVGHWRFDEGVDNSCSGGTNDTCNSGNGGSSLDGAGSGFASPATSTSGWTQTGKFGRALNFDGTDDYVDAGGSASVLGLTEGTFSVWVKISNLDRMVAIAGVGNGGTDTSSEWSLQFRGDGTRYLQVLSYPTNGSAANLNALTPSNTISTTGWHHIAVTVDGSNLKVYVDGASQTLSGTVANKFFGNASAATKLVFGRKYQSTIPAYFEGAIDDVKVYNYPLTADEVKVDMNRGASQVLGASGNNSSSSSYSSSQEYCIPGDSTSCAAPVGRWDFEEGNGSNARDTSGNANNGTITNAVYTPGKVGNGLSFDGNGDFVTVSSSTLSGTSYTVEGWFNTSDTTQGLIFAQRGATGIHAQIGVSQGLGAGSFVLYVRDDASNAAWAKTSDSFLTAGTWYHFAAVRSGNSLTMYINGKSEGTGTGSFGTITSTGAAIGYNPFNVSTYWNGKGDNIGVFNYARSAAQVAWDYNRGAPVGHWRMDECQGLNINDWSGNNNTGTLTIGASGTQTSAGTCQGSANTAWKDGVSGKLNYSLDFDGTDDYIDLGDLARLEATGDFTISAWIKTTGSPTSDMIVAKKDDSSNGYYLWINSSGKLNGYFVKQGVAAADAASTSSVNDNNWHHVIFRRSTDTSTLFIDGRQDGTNTASATTGDLSNTVSFRIGRSDHTATSQYYFNGQIDDVRVYNYALTATQVKDVFNGGAVNFKPVTGAP